MPIIVTWDMVDAAMRAFEKRSPLLRYKEVDGWHANDRMAMQSAIQAALSALDDGVAELISDHDAETDANQNLIVVLQESVVAQMKLIVALMEHLPPDLRSTFEKAFKESCRATRAH